MTHGIILIDKPAGMTSFGVVARLRRVLTAQAKAQATPGNPAPKRVKVGHTGTLDPFATGLMILVVGKECKNAQRYSKLSKVYQATITLGATSSTGDPEGTITPQAGAVPPATPGSPYARMSVAAPTYAAWRRISARRWVPGRTVVACGA